MIHIIKEIKLLMLPSNRLFMTSRLATVGRARLRKHIRGSASCLVTWNMWRFSVGYFSILDKSERHMQITRQRKTNDRPDPSSERAPQKDKTANFRKQPSDRK
jgi:hypothetical protein